MLQLLESSSRTGVRTLSRGQRGLFPSLPSFTSGMSSSSSNAAASSSFHSTQLKQSDRRSVSTAGRALARSRRAPSSQTYWRSERAKTSYVYVFTAAATAPKSSPLARGLNRPPLCTYFLPRMEDRAGALSNYFLCFSIPLDPTFYFPRFFSLCLPRPFNFYRSQSRSLAGGCLKVRNIHEGDWLMLGSPGLAVSSAKERERERASRSVDL